MCAATTRNKTLLFSSIESQFNPPVTLPVNTLVPVELAPDGSNNAHFALSDLASRVRWTECRLEPNGKMRPLRRGEKPDLDTLCVIDLAEPRPSRRHSSHVTRKQFQALQLRDAAIRKLQEDGTPQFSNGWGHYIWWTDGRLEFAYRSPDNRLPADVALRASATRSVEYVSRLSFGLNIWEPGRKVLNIEWQDDGFFLMSFRRGLWEEVTLGFRNLHAVEASHV